MWKGIHNNYVKINYFSTFVNFLEFMFYIKVWIINSIDNQNLLSFFAIV